MQTSNALVTVTMCSAEPSTPVQPRIPAEANVVANCAVGFGDPDIVTVGALESGEGELEFWESLMVKVEEEV